MACDVGRHCCDRRVEHWLLVGCAPAGHVDDDFAPEPGQRHELGSGHRSLPRSEVGEPHELFNQIVFLGLVTLILTATVWRSRQLLRRQVAAESERASLSRYFSPNIVRELSANASALDRPVVREAAILFADMVGSRPDRANGARSPDWLLREFHRLERPACGEGPAIAQQDRRR